MVRATVLCLLGMLAVAHAGSTELSPKNFDNLVLNSGKNAFVKFQAPW